MGIQHQAVNFGSFLLLLHYCYYRKINDTSKVLREKRYDGDDDDADTSRRYSLVIWTDAKVKCNKTKQENKTKYETYSIRQHLKLKDVNTWISTVCLSNIYQLNWYTWHACHANKHRRFFFLSIFFSSSADGKFHAFDICLVIWLHKSRNRPFNVRWSVKIMSKTKTY